MAAAEVRVRELLMRPCVAHAAMPDADLPQLIAATQSCDRCLVTHPTTGEWVTCRSVAPPL